MLQRFKKSRSKEDFLALSSSLGYTNPTMLEQCGVPVILQGKDVVVETSPNEDATNVFVLPLFRRSSSPGHGVDTIILAATADAVKRIAKQFKALSTGIEPQPTAIQIGVDDNIRKELQLLARPYDIIMGTPERLIDHIRRDNIALGKIRRVLIDLPEDFQDVGFDKDVLFIYSKLPSKVQTVLVTQEAGEPLPLASVLHHPHVVKIAEAEKPSYRVYQCDREEAKPGLLSELLFAQGLPAAVVMCRNAAAARAVSDHFNNEGIACRFVLSSSPLREKESAAKELEEGGAGVVVTDAYAGDPVFARIGMPILFSIPESARLPELNQRGRIMVLCSPEESDKLRKLQEAQHVEMSNSPSSDEVLKGRIGSMVKRIRENENPDELNKYRKAIRKNVPFFLRGYFAAFVLKESMGKQTTPTAQGEMKTLFVSIGKNRKVFPRDLSRVFSTALKIKSTSIGNIKVLDNYSFVDIPESLAEKAISALDGSDFRGRKITVNHARKRDEKEE